MKVSTIRKTLSKIRNKFGTMDGDSWNFYSVVDTLPEMRNEVTVEQICLQLICAKQTRREHRYLASKMKSV